MPHGERVGTVCPGHGGWGQRTVYMEAITGERGAGKTSALADLAGALAHRGVEVGGVVQLVHFDGDVRTGYDLVCLGRGDGLIEVGTLGDLREDPEHPQRLAFARRAPTETGFVFDERLWGLAGEAIREARRTADVLVVDELGWIESEGGGHLPALAAPLAEERCARWLLSVREDRLETMETLLGRFRRTWRVPDEAEALMGRWETWGPTDGRTEQD